MALGSDLQGRCWSVCTTSTPGRGCRDRPGRKEWIRGTKEQRGGKVDAAVMVAEKDVMVEVGNPSGERGTAEVGCGAGGRR